MLECATLTRLEAAEDEKNRDMCLCGFATLSDEEVDREPVITPGRIGEEMLKRRTRVAHACRK